MDGELSQAQQEMLHRHMETCPQCRERFQALQKTDAMIREMETPAPTADFDRTFWRKVADLEDRRTKHPWLRFFLTGWRPVLATGVAAGLAAVIFISTGRDQGLTPEEMFIAQNVELLRNFDVIDQLDLLEQWDAVQTMKDSI